MKRRKQGRRRGEDVEKRHGISMLVTVSFFVIFLRRKRHYCIIISIQEGLNMQELYSKSEDCMMLFQLLKRHLGKQIDYYGTAYTELFSGNYFSHYRESHRAVDYYFGEGIPFYYKFCKDGFLRIQVGNSIYHKTSMSEKLAALSDFYEVFSEVFGEPTAFFTTKEDEEELLSMHWSFVNQEEDIQALKNGTFFDDAELDKVIIMGESKEKTDGYQFNDLTKKVLAKHIGLPFEMLPLVDENIEDFVQFKTGKELRIQEEAKTDGSPVTVLEKKRTWK